MERGRLARFKVEVGSRVSRLVIKKFIPPESESRVPAPRPDSSMRARRPRSQRIQPTGTLRCPRMKLYVLEVIYGPVLSKPMLSLARSVDCRNLAGITVYLADPSGPHLSTA